MSFSNQSTHRFFVTRKSHAAPGSITVERILSIAAIFLPSFPFSSTKQHQDTHSPSLANAWTTKSPTGKRKRAMVNRRRVKIMMMCSNFLARLAARTRRRDQCRPSSRFWRRARRSAMSDGQASNLMLTIVNYDAIVP